MDSRLYGSNRQPMTFDLARAGYAASRISSTLKGSTKQFGWLQAPATKIILVRSGDIGNRTFRRHGLHFWPEGVVQGLQSFLLQINIAEIVIHKTDQPDAVVNFFDADRLAGEGYAEVDLLVVQAKTSATGDHDGAVVERVVRIGDA